MMRIACDTGGTFTDLIVEDDDGALDMYKASTTPHDPVIGVIDAVRLAAEARGLSLGAFLSGVDTFIHGTTHAINAVITKRTAKTAFLTTEGHPDVLVLREGGRQEPFNFTIAYPDPYVPRSLTYEVPGRIASAGEVVTPLDEKAVKDICASMRDKEVEAVAVCLLWSVANPEHELQVGKLIEEYLPGTPYTLSHVLNPTIREFRRASATAIDASLKPLMGAYLGSLSSRLNEAGFSGRLLVLTSQGGMVDAGEIAAAPIRAINSGPSLAPIAGKHFGDEAMPGADVIVADTGGTTYDVSLVRGGRIPLTRDAWIGAPFRGHLTGFPSVDVQSVGAGGGSIAHVDSGGLLGVGPESAGADPGPISYRRGGTEPTLSDACIVLGYLDPDYFLGGTMSLDIDGARRGIEEKIATPLAMSIEDAALSIVQLATENMVQAIADITVNQGIDPRKAVLIGGGGAAGLNSIFIARRLGIPRLVIPELGPALSAAGALMSELAADYRAVEYMTTDSFDMEQANAILSSLKQKAVSFLDDVGGIAHHPAIEFSVEARYEQQVWEIDVPLTFELFEHSDHIAELTDAMHRTHERIFGFRDEYSPVEIIGWSVRASCRVHDHIIGRLPVEISTAKEQGDRNIWLPGVGACAAQVVSFVTMETEERHSGPAVVESPFTTVVIDEASIFWRCEDGSLVVDLMERKAAA